MRCFAVPNTRHFLIRWFTCAGERYVYKFVCDPDALFNMAYGNNCADQQSLSSSCRGSSIGTFNAAATLNDSNLTQAYYN